MSSGELGATGVGNSGPGEAKGPDQGGSEPKKIGEGVAESEEEYETRDLSPRQITRELDRFIVGQEEAKKAVANALRSRWRRNRVPLPLRDEIIPKNILMIGHTGVGKTEIARRLAKLAQAPFIKVEATKFTEIGYVGRDVDSIMRDLVDRAVLLVKEKHRKVVAKQARKSSEEIILNCLVGVDASEETKSAFRERLRSGEFEDSEISISVKENKNVQHSFDVPGMPGSQVGIMNINEIVQKMLGGNKQFKSLKTTVKEAREILLDEETEKLIDEDKIVREALHIASNEGIVFLDEIDKIAARTEIRGEVNREGVQRDLLPLLEGTSVSTKYGTVTTDHVLFIASGAFHLAKPSDLLPELQGRLPIRVELKPLGRDDLIRILTEPESNLLRQYRALMETEGVNVEFTEDGILAIAEIASTVNREVENIGARRLHTILEKLMEDISYSASENKGKTYVIDGDHVREKLEDISKQMDLSKFIL
ncbi:ATP-dependent protease ATPase subunit HslU [Anaplasma marginale]|nr:ATP-dependent protease ATPase subunit HslU [Anaplasma marginale]AXW84573.1 ATP-dependent protease ATPase subunit HslU [Anaplasma marginale]AXW85213.1 ATP-dependent protease ATPase subunit HslU [Anaplasma marginale]KAA8472760.1 ATP-dependent protease ATPase subunit HslU [Anaplasma marginale]KAA8473420.1 ATP-dependent protease ATPase subunit HslU [Anaplasma marginale]KAB0451069.1 ATP-dependent protease ATPase subunit HslU [Anaplasma marginale]